MKLSNNIKLGLFGSTDEPEKIQEVINNIVSNNQWKHIEYITGSLGYVANVMTEYDFEPEQEYNRCIIFWDGSEECIRESNYCKQHRIPCYLISKQVSTGFLDRIVVANIKTYKPSPNDYTVYVGRGFHTCNYNARLGNPFTVEQYGRGIAIQKYKEWIEPSKLEPLAEHLKSIKDKRIVLLCWCKPNPCHADVIKEMLIKLGV